MRVLIVLFADIARAASALSSRIARTVEAPTLGRTRSNTGFFYRKYRQFTMIVTRSTASSFAHDAGCSLSTTSRTMKSERTSARLQKVGGCHVRFVAMDPIGPEQYVRVFVSSRGSLSGRRVVSAATLLRAR